MKFAWHRIRGHKIKAVNQCFRFMDYSRGPGGVETGGVAFFKQCSCGTRWRLEIHPYTARRQWV